MKLIEKYIFKQLVSSSVLLLLLIISIFSLSKSVQLIELSLNRGLPLIYFFKLIMLSLPAIIPVLLPVVICLSVFFTYSRMRNDSELIILEGSGSSKFQLTKPVLIYGITLLIISLLFTIFFSPNSNKDFKKLLYSIKNDYSSSLLEEGTFNTIGKDYTIFLKKRNSEGELTNVFIHDTRNIQKPTTLIAEKGLLLKSKNGNSMLLENGSQHFFSNVDKKLSVLYFEKYLLSLDNDEDQNFSSRWKSPSERTFYELNNPNMDNGDDVNNLQAFKAEIIHRFTLPLNILTFSFFIVSFILSQRFLRIENIFFNLKILVIILLMKGLYVFCSNLAIKNENFELINLLPSILFLILGLRLLTVNSRRIS